MSGFFALLLLIGGAIIIVVFIIQRNQKAKRDALQRAFTLSDVDNMDGLAFEHYVANLLRSEGYSKVEVSKASGDFGVDITAFKSSLRYAIQVKRYTGTVSRRAVSDAVAGKGHYSCDLAMVITNSYLSKQSKEFARSVRCEIVDRDILGEWILRFQASGPQDQSITRSQKTTISPHIMVAPAEPQFVTRIQSSPLSEQPIEQKNLSIPSDVIHSIKAYAASQHPKDFSTQSYVVQEQIEAYSALNKIRPSNIPKEILDNVLRQAEQDFPHDYSTRLYVLKEQIEAYLAVVKLTPKNIPAATLEVILEDANRDYPYDFSTRLYVINEQIESYNSLTRL